MVLELRDSRLDAIIKVVTDSNRGNLTLIGKRGDPNQRVPPKTPDSSKVEPEKAKWRFPVSRIIMLLVLAWASQSAIAQRARVDFDHGCHFSSYKTFSLVPSFNGQAQDTAFPNQLMRERITKFIEGALVSRGFRRIESGGDLLVSYEVDVTELPIYTTFDNGWGWGWGDGISTTTTELTYRGTLIVNIQDAHRRQLVFQGVSNLSISSKPARNSRKLGKAVNEIFEKYPPQT